MIQFATGSGRGVYLTESGSASKLPSGNTGVHPGVIDAASGLQGVIWQDPPSGPSGTTYFIDFNRGNFYV